MMNGTLMCVEDPSKMRLGIYVFHFATTWKKKTHSFKLLTTSNHRQVSASPEGMLVHAPLRPQVSTMSPFNMLQKPRVPTVSFHWQLERIRAWKKQ